MKIVSSMKPITLYAGYLLIPGKQLIYDPTHPEAVYLVAADEQGRYSILRQLGDRQWEQLYHVDRQPFSLEELTTARLVVEYHPRSRSFLRELVLNLPRRFTQTTGRPLRPRPDQKCHKCQTNPAIATLSSYDNRRTTSHLIRSFCRDCLSTGEVAPAHRICHICRQRPADLLIWAEETKKENFYEFRVHTACVARLDDHLTDRPSLEERRCLRRIVLTGEV
jgi:ribosomal protein L32